MNDEATQARAEAKAAYLRQVRERALRAAVRQRPDLAMRIACLMMARQKAIPAPIATWTPGENENDLARTLSSELSVGGATVQVAVAPNADVLVTFAHLIANTIWLSDKSDEWTEALFALCSARGAAMREHISRAFHAPTWLAHCTPDECAAIQQELGTPLGVDLSQGSTAFILGRLCGVHGWLPQELRKHLSDQVVAGPHG